MMVPFRVDLAQVNNLSISADAYDPIFSISPPEMMA